MELALDKAKISVKVNGVAYPCRSLKLGEYRNVVKELTASKDDMEKTMDVYINLFKLVGLPDEAIDEFDMEFVVTLANALLMPKKKDEKAAASQA